MVTPSRDRPAAAASLRGLAAAAAEAVRLAIGRGAESIGHPVAPWDEVFSVATRECLGALAWVRSGAEIRAGAPAPVVAAWRAHALSLMQRADVQIGSLGAACAALESSGVRAVVLKGAPLAQRLYGDPRLRYSADLDLYVPLPSRADARRALVEAGWEFCGGGPPWDESFALRRGDEIVKLDVHSSLVGDVLAHLPVPPPESSPVTVGGFALQAADGALLAPYLAAHLAKHRVFPLLWAVDFHTLWESLDAASREASHRAARSAGLGRYLEWGARLSADVSDAAAADRAALARLGFSDVRRGYGTPALRDLALAPTAADALRAAAAWLAPPATRQDWRAFARRSAHRLLSPLGWMRPPALYGARPVAPPDEGAGRAAEGSIPAVPAVPIGGEELSELARDILTRGESFWLTVRGRSMQPTIPSGSEVRVVPLRGRAPRVGDVALARLPSGAPVVHRVRRADSATVVLRGDSVVACDPPVASEWILGRVDAVRTDAGVRPLSSRAPIVWRVSAARLRRWLAFRVRHAR